MRKTKDENPQEVHLVPNPQFAKSEFKPRSKPKPKKGGFDNSYFRRRLSKIRRDWKTGGLR